MFVTHLISSRVFLLHEGITSWVKNWKTNGWRLKTGGEVVNKDDFQKLDELNEELDVKWVSFLIRWVWSKLEPCFV